MRTSVLWFRRDLRLGDHPGLEHALATSDRVVPLFVVDDALADRARRSPNRAWFMARCVEALAAALEERGSALTVVRGRPAEVVPRFAAEVGADRIIVTRECTPYARARDARVRDAAAAAGIAFEAGRGLLIHEPEQVLTGEERPYSVFGPFRRTWERLPVRDVLAAPDRVPGAPPAGIGRAGVDAALGSPRPTADPDLLLEPGEAAARRRLAAWSGSDALEQYDEGRDRLDHAGTSRLSQDLRFGLLSPVEVVRWCAGPGLGRARFLSELAWRDFYAHLLWWQPRIAREAQRANLEHVAWEHDEAVIAAWRAGRTGYPVVDAAMRQLLATGWMHNRSRMIVASFLTKHLGVDWRIGEEHFMAHLVDADVASNNGGWQWAASTGADPQPYFRVFNPTLQGRRHDPDGAYVRRWVPELAGVSGAAIHDPGPLERAAAGYPPPIVDHAEARQRALARYEAAGR